MNFDKCILLILTQSHSSIINERVFGDNGIHILATIATIVNKATNLLRETYIQLSLLLQYNYHMLGPISEYVTEVWDLMHYKFLIHKIEMVQRHAAKWPWVLSDYRFHQSSVTAMIRR